ncbi:hypothetical protein DCAR_0625402 [Daucus carota subsp. sativus]|uniref:Sulfotransferase n=1 Tax=Daucus carota subsp. sativus TaxID=79200 RepID=A0AAF0XFQ5_DAUCS|nr:hypothetical protein DCAR_0625402 [Daucus carota subsp. sativus]
MSCIVAFCLSRLQDILAVKAPKKSPLLLRTTVVIFAVFCGLYMFSICIKQTRFSTASRLLDIRVNYDQPCNTSVLQEKELPYLHLPKPKSFTRKECACNPVRFFVILSMQRSGSGWFETLLNSHINISSNGEIFGNKDRRSNASTIVQVLDQVYNLDWLSSASKNECSAAVGFKWMLNQGAIANHKEVVEYFNRRGVSAIFLFRRNLLRRMISMDANAYDKSVKLLNGTHKSHVHSPKEAQILAQYKPKLNTTDLVSNLKEVQGTARRGLELFKSTRHIVLYYEDIVSNRTKLVDVLEFLKVPYRELTSRQVKIHSGPLSQHISNWEDVKKALKGTSFESYLKEDYK